MHFTSHVNHSARSDSLRPQSSQTVRFFCFYGRSRKASNTSSAWNRLKQERICVSTDGPFENVLKFKPPMCFSIEDAELVGEKIDSILTGKSGISEAVTLAIHAQLVSVKVK